MKYCTFCGKELSDQAKFCTSCGRECGLHVKAKYEPNQSAKIDPVTSTKKECDIQEKKKLRPWKVIILFTVLASIIIVGIIILWHHDAENVGNPDNHIFMDTNDSDQVSFPLEGEYDEVLAYGDGFYLVSKFVETYDSATTLYGVVNDNDEWVCRLSNSNGFEEAAETVQNGYTQAYYPIVFDYIGEKMFLIRTACIILGEDEIPNGYRGVYAQHGKCRIVRVDGKTIGSGGYIVTKFNDGCTFTQSGPAGLVHKIDKEGNTTTLGYCDDYIGEPSCGLICLDYVFYDTETCEPRIDLTEFNISEDSKTLKFDENGELYFTFYNPAGHKYHVTIDTNGNYLYEPRKVGE